jgi:hypothetical protein
LDRQIKQLLAIHLHPIKRGELGGIQLMAEGDRLIAPAAAVSEADSALPDLTVPTVGRRPEMDLDRPIPDSRAAEEGMPCKRGSIYCYTEVFL